MAVSLEGEVVGSVSGGCVEGAVVTKRSHYFMASESPALSPLATAMMKRLLLA